MSPVDGGGGAFRSENVGGRNYSYQLMAEGPDVFYLRTPYGREYLMLSARATAWSVFSA